MGTEGGAAIVILARDPAPGEVLPKVAAEIGDVAAAEVYKCFVADTIARVRRLPRMALYVSVARSARPDAAEPWPSEDVPLIEQEGGSVGERLVHAFDYGLGQGHDRVIAIGAASPNIPVKAVREAAEHLRFLEVVLGPCEQGGFYLIGSRGRFPEFFREVPWEDAPETGAAVGRAMLCGLEYAALDQWYSVETMDDLRLLGQFIQFDVSEDNPCPNTAAWLKRNL